MLAFCGDREQCKVHNVVFSPDMKTKLAATGADFLRQELKLGMTFLELAKATTDPTTKRRNLANARKAYQTVRRLKISLWPPKEDRAEIADGLAKMKAALEAAESLG